MDHEETLNTLKTLALSGVLLAVPLFLILEQPDLKNTITVVVIFCIMIYIAGLSYKIIGGALLIAVPLTIIFYQLLSSRIRNCSRITREAVSCLFVSGKRRILG